MYLNINLLALAPNKRTAYTTHKTFTYKAKIKTSHNGGVLYSNVLFAFQKYFFR